MDAIEAAARAMYRYHNLREATNDAWRLYESEARAAIAAYLEATGVERDAERYRWLRQQDEGGRYWIASGSRGPWGECGHSCVYEEVADDCIDSARGDEHG